MKMDQVAGSKDEKPALNPPFSTGYFCHHILPQQICFEEIDKKDCKMEEN